MSARNQTELNPVNVALGKSAQSAIDLTSIPFDEICTAVNLSTEAMRRRLSGSLPFLCIEVVQLANFLNMPVSDLIADSFDQAVTT
ncbi:hypothetical protein R3Q06_18060 [Rhodococcus erythropolis]|uniref:hypothetical protein n=1 Tax=Rhodococcus erythropolis TaxID=1833 RepID=UPI00294A96EA|nr:hypothetical protein [Rhodococcus erythropolis]MDV6275403.1 hypothetical protein [Rhodococcus erythropolis]